MPPPVEESPTGPLDRDGRVRIDLACLKCGYNLRTLAVDGLCPECALPVERSIRGDLLKYADPRWVRRLALSAELLFIAAIAPLVVAPMVGLAIALSDPWPQTGDLLFAVAGVGGMVAGVAVLAGFLGITTREPRISLRPEGVSARRVCRYSLLALAVLVVISVAPSLFSGAWSWWTSRLCAMASLVTALGVLPLSFLQHLASLLRRVPAEDLAGTARAVALVVCAVDLLLILPVSAELLTGGAIGIAEGCLAGVAAVFAGVCYLVGLYVLNGARKSFRQAADEAGAA